ncbi:MAG: PH domain-containing protein [Patulibacter minatonensis]
MSQTAPGDPPAAEQARLPERALRLWRLTSLLSGVPIVAIGVVVAIAVPGLPSALRVLIGAVPVVLVVSDLLAQPVRYRLWWYRVDAEELTIQHGWPVTRLTVVPMVRVQHVSVSHGPLARLFALADLKVSTAAGTVSIPSLDRDQADRIRERIADLARIVDDL